MNQAAVLQVEASLKSLDEAFDSLKYNTQVRLGRTFEVKETSDKCEFSILKKKLMLEINKNEIQLPKKRSGSFVINDMADVSNYLGNVVKFKEPEFILDQDSHKTKILTSRKLSCSVNDPYDSDVSMDILELYDRPKKKDLFNSIDSSLSDFWTSSRSDSEYNSKTGLSKSLAVTTQKQVSPQPVSSTFSLPRCKNISTFQSPSQKFGIKTTSFHRNSIVNDNSLPRQENDEGTYRLFNCLIKKRQNAMRI
jgi:hypothetical protein